MSRNQQALFDGALMRVALLGCVEKNWIRAFRYATR